MREQALKRGVKDSLSHSDEKIAKDRERGTEQKICKKRKAGDRTVQTRSTTKEAAGIGTRRGGTKETKRKRIINNLKEVRRGRVPGESN